MARYARTRNLSRCSNPLKTHPRLLSEDKDGILPFMNRSAPSFGIRQLFKAFWFFLEGHRVKFIVSTIGLLVIFFYPLIPPLLIGRMIDFLTHYHPGDDLRTLYFLVLAVGGGHIVASLIRLTLKNKLGDLETEASYSARVKGFARLTDFSLTWHDQEGSGNKMQRITSGVEAIGGIRRIMSQTGFSVLADVIGISIIFLFLRPLFILFLLGYFGVFALVHVFFAKKTKIARDDLNKAKEAAAGRYFEGLSNILTIKTLGAKRGYQARIDVNENRTKELSYRIRRLFTDKWKAFQVVNGVGIGIYLYLVGTDVASGTATVGSIFIFWSYLIRLVEAANDSTDIIEQLIEYTSAMGRMMPIYWESEDRVDGTKIFPKTWKAIHVKNAQFRYPTYSSTMAENRFRLKRLNLTIHRGERIGIAGASGSGKSTIGKILLGLYQIDDGALTVDNTPLATIHHESLTQYMTAVLQDSEMFNVSFRDNITLMRKMDEKLFRKAIRIAQLEGLIKRLPDGVETLLGEKGYRLSGGERQRIGIARAVYKQPDILILDEATSSLDSRTERLVQQALEQELPDTTMIVIAHRISTLKQMDRILVFDRGSIVEEGTYASLLKNPHSLFSQINKSRSKKEEGAS